MHEFYGGGRVAAIKRKIPLLGRRHSRKAAQHGGAEGLTEICGAGLGTAIQDSRGIRTTFGYDAAGGPGGARPIRCAWIMTYVYDIAGRQTVRVELAGEAATLTLSLDGVDGAALYGSVRLDVPGSRAKIILPIALVGFDLARFAEELERLSATLEGTAELRASSETFLLGMSIMEDGNAVRVKVSVDCNLTQNAATDGTLAFRFDGFIVDQTYLHLVASDVWRFIREYGVPTMSPWSQ